MAEIPVFDETLVAAQIDSVRIGVLVARTLAEMDELISEEEFFAVLTNLESAQMHLDLARAALNRDETTSIHLVPGSMDERNGDRMSVKKAEFRVVSRITKSGSVREAGVDSGRARKRGHGAMDRGARVLGLAILIGFLAIATKVAEDREPYGAVMIGLLTEAKK